MCLSRLTEHLFDESLNMPLAFETVEPALVLDQLSKNFGKNQAVNKLSLSIDKGEIFGLLGPNASGKTTTIRMLTGIIKPSAGNARILGHDLLTDTASIKHHIGYVAQYFGLYPELTVLENLRFYAGLYNSSVVHTPILEQYGLSRFSQHRAGTLSGGYQRRLSMACAITHDPEIVFLDEPTAGIDPVSRKEIWDLFYDMAAAGKALFVSTHYMEEAERCHKLAFLNRGKRVAYGSPDEIRDLLGDCHIWAVQVPHNPQLMHDLAQIEGIKSLNRFGRTLRIIGSIDCDINVITKVMNRFTAASVNIAPVTANLEDIFISLTDNKAVSTQTQEGQVG